MGHDAGVPPPNERDYFQIFSDRLIVPSLPAFTKTPKRKIVATEKFYFFDLGFMRSLAGFGLGEVSLANPDLDKALKHLEFLPCRDNYLKDMSIQ